MFNLFETKSVETYQPPVALTIAGSDSGGGAGIQADLKTFASNKVFGTSVLTLITAQNTRGVSAIEVLANSLIAAQYNAVMSDISPAVAKTGALGDERVFRLLAELLEETPIDKLVVDPVMVSKHGAPLLSDAAMAAFGAIVVPHAYIITPNRFEAEALTKRRVEGVSSMQDAARAIFDMGAKYVVVKGPHLDDTIVRDIFYDGTGFIEFGADRVRSESVHGSGCTFSAAITARLAHGDGIEDSVAFAREFISGAIEKAPEIGAGISPVNPMHRVWNA